MKIAAAAIENNIDKGRNSANIVVNKYCVEGEK